MRDRHFETTVGGTDNKVQMYGQTERTDMQTSSKAFWWGQQFPFESRGFPPTSSGRKSEGNNAVQLNEMMRSLAVWGHWVCNVKSQSPVHLGF